MICELYFNKTVTAKLKTGKQNKRLKRFGGKTKKKKNALQTPPPKKAAWISGKRKHRKQQAWFIKIAK